MIVSNETKIPKKYPKIARTFHFISNEQLGNVFSQVDKIHTLHNGITIMDWFYGLNLKSKTSNTNR